MVRVSKAGGSLAERKGCNKKWWGLMLTPGLGHAKLSVGFRDGTMLINWDSNLLRIFLCMSSKPDAMIAI